MLSPARKSGICSAVSAFTTPTRVMLGKSCPLAIIWVPTRDIGFCMADRVEVLHHVPRAGHRVPVDPDDARSGRRDCGFHLESLRAEALPHKGPTGHRRGNTRECPAPNRSSGIGAGFSSL